MLERIIKRFNCSHFFTFSCLPYSVHQANRINKTSKRLFWPYLLFSIAQIPTQTAQSFNYGHYVLFPGIFQEKVIFTLYLKQVGIFTGGCCFQARNFGIRSEKGEEFINLLYNLNFAKKHMLMFSVRSVSVSSEVLQQPYAS